MPVALVDPLGNQQLPGVLPMTLEEIADIGTRGQGDIRSPMQHHEQVAVVGIAQDRIEVFREEMRIGVEVGKTIMVAIEQRQTLASEPLEITLAAPRLDP